MSEIAKQNNEGLVKLRCVGIVDQFCSSEFSNFESNYYHLPSLYFCVIFMILYAECTYDDYSWIKAIKCALLTIINSE